MFYQVLSPFQSGGVSLGLEPLKHLPLGTQSYLPPPHPQELSVKLSHTPPNAVSMQRYRLSDTAFFSELLPVSLSHLICTKTLRGDHDDYGIITVHKARTAICAPFALMQFYFESGVTLIKSISSSNKY